MSITEMRRVLGVLRDSDVSASLSPVHCSATYRSSRRTRACPGSV